jgi:quercetin dioxygenase-like cupin family protein
MTTDAADYVLIDRNELAAGDDTVELGSRFAGAGVSFILVDMEPGGRVRLHRHAYPEIFVVHEGRATYTVGAATLEVSAGQVVVVAAGVPHAFANTGEGRLRQTDVHLAGSVLTEWLEDPPRPE